MLRSLFFSAGLILSATAVAGVYKWVDDNGRLHYTDKPPATGAQRMAIESQRTDPSQITARVEARRESQEQELEQQQETEEQRRLEQQREEVREENCRRSRRALESLLSATRLYEPLPGGDRRYLEQDEIDQRMDKARKDVEEYCGAGS